MKGDVDADCINWYHPEKVWYQLLEDDSETTCKSACSKKNVIELTKRAWAFTPAFSRKGVQLRCSPAPKSKSTASKFTCEEPGGAKREVKGLKGPEDTKGWCHCVAVGK